MKAKTHRAAKRGGFSIVELLIAVIIIAILVSVIIPIVSDRARQARLATARSDLEHIADAQQRVALDIGYYVRLFVLDDITGGDGLPTAFPTNPDDHVDGLADERLAGPGSYPAYHKVWRLTGSPDRPDQFFIDPKTQGWLDGDAARNLLRSIEVESPFNASLALPAWEGAYLNWRRDSDMVPNTNTFYPDDIGNDPWGSNYVLFTAKGMVLEPALDTSSPYYTSDEGFVTKYGNTTMNVFDRPTVVSYGPDTMPGGYVEAEKRYVRDRVGVGDDLVIHF